MNDYKELIAHAQDDAAFRHIISECGADGRVWFDKKFICDYVAHLKFAVVQLTKERDELVGKTEQFKKERDAAIADLKKAMPCKACKHLAELEHCMNCYSENHWEWRGVNEEEQYGN